MKFNFSALVFSVASLTFLGYVCPDLHAKNAKTTFFSASDNAAQTFSGPTTTPPITPIFIPLTFTQHLHHHGHSIKSNGDQFRLKKGTYLVSFTATFTAGSQVTVAPTYFDIALQVGSKLFFVNTDSHFALDPDAPTFSTSTGIASFNKIIEIDDDHKDLSVVVRNTSSFQTVTATTRSITIKKLK